MKFVSPNHLHTAAKQHYLEGRDPVTVEEWGKCVNYWAANIAYGTEANACYLMARIYNCPLPHGAIVHIANLQAAHKKRQGQRMCG